MIWIFNDGGRADTGRRGSARDCVCRAIAIAGRLPYADVYAALAAGAGAERNTRGASARNGIFTSRAWFKRYMVSLGFTWTPTMRIGSGCTVHLRADELPAGRLVVSVSRHYTAVIDGVIHDTHNPSDRAETIYGSHVPEYQIPRGAKRLSNGNGWVYAPERCVYGYWVAP